ncbi:hypothetical protein RND71_044187 [Anisodus tanguticus]|uniref:Plus3 domain-containing protein n=1 Tax=Anisodus tanguticus TaxID=243964 RepID=A0AAE1UNA7_9SOLA|nr:hypothetical protein RND71_044187 [Anisodus tanguticus]
MKLMNIGKPREVVKLNEAMAIDLGAELLGEFVIFTVAAATLTGIVLDIGDGVTHICPVYEGFALSHLTRRLDIAGRDITRYLNKLLLLRGYAFNHSADFETVRILKEKLCYIAYNIKQEMKLSQETTYVSESYSLPDGRVIKLGSERFEAPEVLFQPHLINVEGQGIAELLFNTIQSGEIDIRSELYRHIVLSGGSTMYPGLPSRLEKELKQLYLERVLNGNVEALSRFKIRIEDPPRRKDIVFSGGSVLANAMKNCDKFWLTKDMYNELEQREKRKQKAKLRASDVYSSSDDDEEDYKKRKSSSSSSSSSSDFSDSDRRRKRSDDEDDSRFQREEIPFDLDAKILNSIRLSRFKMSQWCHTPFFKDTIIGCFVRLSIGVNKDKTPVYRIAEIVDVIDGPKAYDLEKTKTDKLLKLKHGRDEKNFRIQYVSNTEFTDKEFSEWKFKMEKERLTLPNKKQIEDKQKHIHGAINYNFKESDIEAIVKEKEKYIEVPVNFAMKKTHLKKQKDMAEQLGDHVEVERITQLLEEVEEKAKELDYKRTQNISAISYINERNRMRNIVEAEKAILLEREQDKHNKDDDPFKRRKCAPMLVSMVKKQAELSINDEDKLSTSNQNTSIQNGLKQNRDMIYDCTSTNFDGLTAIMSPEDSWVAKWLRINTLVPGIYAISVSGKLPPGIIRELKSRGFNYKNRDRSAE